MIRAALHRQFPAIALAVCIPHGAATAEIMVTQAALLACGSVAIYEQMHERQSLVGCGHFDAGTKVSVIKIAAGYVHFDVLDIPAEQSEDMPAHFVAPAGSFEQAARKRRD